MDGDTAPTSFPPPKTYARGHGTLLLEKFAVILLFATPFADLMVGIISLSAGLFTGYDAEQKLLTLLPGMAFRAILLFLLVLLLWRRGETAAIVVIGVFTGLFLISECIALVEHQTLGYFVYGVSYLFKLVFILTFFLYAATVPVNSAVLAAISRVLCVSFAVYTLAVTIGHITGWEYTTYGGLGSSGFMIKGSANSISLIILVGTIFVLHRIMESGSAGIKLWWVLVFVNGFYAAILLLTKGAILGLVLPAIAYGARRILNSASPIPYLAVLTLIAVLLGVLLSIDWSEVRIVARTLDAIASHGGDILSAIFAGRLEFISYGWTTFLHSYTPHQWLFGAGAAGAREAVGELTGMSQGVESDFLDIGLVYGVIGFGGAVALWSFVLARAAKVLISPAGILAHGMAFNVILLTGLAVIAGHVLTSGLGGHILAMGLALLFRYRRLRPRTEEAV